MALSLGQIRQRDNEINILVSIIRKLEAKYNIKKEDLGREYEGKLTAGKENAQYSPTAQEPAHGARTQGETVAASADLLANQSKAFEL